MTELAKTRGKQELFTRQSPQKFATLCEHEFVDCAAASNRIEEVEVGLSRVATLLFGKPALRDRDEEEVGSYCDALKLNHESSANLAAGEKTTKRLHKLSRGEICEAGAYKEKDLDSIQTYAEDCSRVRFKAVPATSEVVG
jgi:hypothetical protein